MSRYAESTSVSSDRSRAEIERTLKRYGAGKFMYGWNGDSAVIGFEMERRQVRFVLPLPSRTDQEFTRTATGRPRLGGAAEKAYEQAVRQRWRALALVIKAKLEAIEAGISVFEDEFLAHIVLPDGRTVGHWMRPQIASSYENGGMPPMLEPPR